MTPQQRKALLWAIVVVAVGTHLWFCRWRLVERAEHSGAGRDLFAIRLPKEALKTYDNVTGVVMADGVSKEEALLGGVFVPIGLLGFAWWLWLGWRQHFPSRVRYGDVVGRLVSPAASLFVPPYKCTLSFSPAANLEQLDALVRSVCGHGLVLQTVKDGSRRLQLTTEHRPPVFSQSQLPVLDPATVGENAWARAMIRVNARGEIVLVRLHLLPDCVEDLVR